MKTKHIIWIALPLLGAAAWYFLIRKGKGGGGSGASATDPDKVPDKPNPDKPVPDTSTKLVFPLKKGDKGDLVKKLHDALLSSTQTTSSDKIKFKQGYGTFGNLTLSYVQKHLGKATVDNDADINKIWGTAPLLQRPNPNTFKPSIQPSFDVTNLLNPFKL